LAVRSIPPTDQSQPKSVPGPTQREFQNVSPTIKRKKLKHASTRATQTEKKNELVI